MRRYLHADQTNRQRARKISCYHSCANTLLFEGLNQQKLHEVWLQLLCAVKPNHSKRYVAFSHPLAAFSTPGKIRFLAYLILIEPDALTMNDEPTAQQRHMPNCELMTGATHKRKEAQDCACQIAMAAKKVEVSRHRLSSPDALRLSLAMWQNPQQLLSVDSSMGGAW